MKINRILEEMDMRNVLKGRWAILALWLIAAVVLMFIAPNLAEEVRDKGQITVPSDYSSSRASKLLAEMEDSDTTTNATALIFHSDVEMSEGQISQIKDSIESLKSKSDQLGIKSIITHFDQAELASNMVAEDGRTIIVLLDVMIGEDQSPSEVRDALYKSLENVDVDHYLTGDWVIIEDVLISSEEGLKKTEYITVGFILIILFIVFRSATAPFVPLLTVGISYVISQSIVAFLSHYWSFPLSTFTQIFMVAVMFGIGTDYCILLISRYKEELANGNSKLDAILTTYRTAGRTVFISGIAVLVGFSCIGLSDFNLFQSAVAVAVGIAVLLLALYTLVPFFLYVLGEKLFWPMKGEISHGHSKIWDKVGRFSLSKPWLAIIIVAIIIVPLLLGRQNLISYNSLDEIGEKYDSVKGFNILAESFGPGEALPTTVVIKDSTTFASSEGFAAIQQLSRKLKEIDGVHLVRSATRPTGEVMEEFLVVDQVGQLDSGLKEGQQGLQEISEGLAQASEEISSNQSQLDDAIDGAEALSQGSKELKNGVASLKDGLQQLANGMKEGSLSSQQLLDGLKELQGSAKLLSEKSGELLSGYQALATSLTELNNGYSLIGEQQSKLAESLTGIKEGISALGAKYPELTSDPLYVQLSEATTQLESGAQQLAEQLTQLNNGLNTVTTHLQGANEGLKQFGEGQQQFSTGMNEVVAGMGQLQEGLEQLVTGQNQVIGQLPSMSSGIAQLSEGQQQLQQGFVDVQGQLQQLTDGLNQGVDGINQVSDGISTAGDYMNGLINAPDKELRGWYIPDEVIQGDEFKAVLDQYMSEDRNITTIDVVLDYHPYSQEAMDVIDKLDQTVQAQLVGTEYDGAQVEIAGVTSMNHDLQQISNKDYNRTVVLMLIGILIILAVVFRSIAMPIYIIISLLLTYFGALAFTEILFVHVFHTSGVTWAVPFFGFVILLALGVDYSIFLMDRFRENKDMNPVSAIHEAMKSMGTVIMSAAVILGGTFAAMLPSGVMSLLQIATLVLVGLLLYALVVLPLFIPVIVKLLGKYNWWPFISKK